MKIDVYTLNVDDKNKYIFEYVTGLLQAHLFPVPTQQLLYSSIKFWL